MSQAKKVILTPLAIVDLSVSYARKVSDKKIVHYRISDLLSLTDPNGQNPFGRVVEYIREQEGEDVEVSLNDTQQVEMQKMSKNGMVVEDISDAVFKLTSRKTKKDLMGRKTTGLIHQYEYYHSKIDQYKDILSFRFNDILFQVNRFIQFLKRQPYGFGPYSKEGAHYRAVRHFLPRMFDYVNERRGLRMISLVRYIGVTYKESDEKEALQVLARDLDALSAQGLIQGHLSPPSTLFLADTLGSGDRMKAAFCFPLINDQRACQLLNRNPLDMPRTFLSLFGVTGEMEEGGLPPYLNGKDPRQEYEVEVVDILPGRHDEQRRLVIESYLQSRDHVNKIAKAQKEALKDIKPSGDAITEGRMVGAGPVTEINEDGNVVETGEVSEGVFKAEKVHVNLSKVKKDEE